MRNNKTSFYGMKNEDVAWNSLLAPACPYKTYFAILFFFMFQSTPTCIIFE